MSSSVKLLHGEDVTYMLVVTYMLGTENLKFFWWSPDPGFKQRPCDSDLITWKKIYRIK